MSNMRLMLALSVLLVALLYSPRSAATAQETELKFASPVSVGRSGVNLTPTAIPAGCTLQPLADNRLLSFEPATNGQSGTLKAKYPVLTTADEQKTIKLKCKRADNTEADSNDIVVDIKRKATNVRLITVKRNAAGGTVEVVMPPDNLLKILQGESLQVRAFYDEERGNLSIPFDKIELRGDAPSVADVTPGEPPTVKALNPSDKMASFTVQLEGDEAPRPELAFKVKVLSTVSAIIVENGQSLSMAEGDRLPLKLNLTGPNGETYKLSERTDITIDDRPKGVVNISRDGDSVVLTALPLPVGAPGTTTTPVRTTITFKTLRGAGGGELSQDVTVTVTPKFGYITFEPPPRGLLLPYGTATTTAIVHNKTGGILYGLGVEFQHENPDDSKWVTLAPEGNKLNVYWADPPDRNENRNRPSQVRVNVTARPLEGGVINGKIFIRMGEVAKFAPLRVKLDVMDQRTAQDLYGEVTSDEYYVLTVRLFNNLKDQETNEFTGASILAYSSSIEVAVGMEKKFDRDSDTDFPNVIGKDASNRIARERSKAAEDIALNQAQADIAAAKSGHQELLDAAAAQRSAEHEAARLKENFYQRKKEAAEKRDAAARLRRRAGTEREQSEKLIEIARRRRQSATDLRRNAQNDPVPERIARAERAERDADQAEREATITQRAAEAANGRAETALNEWEAAAAAERSAFNNANAQVEAVRLAYDRTASARDSIARANQARTPISQSLATRSDPDTAYDDGRWHSVTPDDFVRITKPKEDPDFRRSLYTEKIPDTALNDLTTMAEDSGAQIKETRREEEQEPICVGTTTYRPFTFEMMVNTVDRRDGRGRRSIAFKLLEAIGTGTSFVTAIAVPGPGSDLPLGLEKFRNLLIPGAERLYPSVKEQQRQNIVSQAMKEIEEIPFGSDITRVIFIPRKPMRGMVKGHEARISEVCPYYFKVEVAIVKKGGIVEQGTLSR